MPLRQNHRQDRLAGPNAQTHKKGVERIAKMILASIGMMLDLQPSSIRRESSTLWEAGWTDISSRAVKRRIFALGENGVRR